MGTFGSFCLRSSTTKASCVILDSKDGIGVSMYRGHSGEQPIQLRNQVSVAGDIIFCFTWGWSWSPEIPLRMEAQQSTFTIHHADQKPLKDWHDSAHVKSILGSGQRKGRFTRRSPRCGH